MEVCVLSYNVHEFPRHSFNRTVLLTSVFHLSLINRKTSYSSSSSFSESPGVLRTGIITMSFSTGITKNLPFKNTLLWLHAPISHYTEYKQTNEVIDVDLVLNATMEKPWVLKRWIVHVFHLNLTTVMLDDLDWARSLCRISSLFSCSTLDKHRKKGAHFTCSSFPAVAACKKIWF